MVKDKKEVAQEVVTQEQFIGKCSNCNENNDAKLDDDQIVKETLIQFVLRVSNGKATSEKEIEVLPEVAQIVLNFSKNPI